MKQVQFAELGTPDVLKVVEAEKPIARPGQVLIRVEAASVNFTDVMARRGEPINGAIPLPVVPGNEVAGTVETVSKDVKCRGRRCGLCKDEWRRLFAICCNRCQGSDQNA
jgi:NADPH:quinone reductase